MNNSINSKNDNEIMSKKFRKTFSENESKIASTLDIEKDDAIVIKSGRYSVEKKMGQGGFGSVYKIIGDNNETLAIKVLDLWRIKANEHKNVRTRFEQEYEAGSVNSEFVVKSYSKGSLEGNPYILMELCEGSNLAGRMLEFYNEKEYTELALQILYGLKALHDRQFIHRDIKPENILFNNERKAKISDFGISGNLKHRITEANLFGVVKEVWCSVLYAPPEQTNRKTAFKSVKPGLDIFSFGVMMYEVISGGKLPFGTLEEAGASPILYQERVAKGQFEDIRTYRSDIKGVWAEILTRCLQPKQEDRFDKVDQIIILLNSISFKRPKIHILNEFVKKPDSNDLILKLIHPTAQNLEFNITDLRKNNNRNFITIGRADADNELINDISIPDYLSPFMSRRHATIEFEGDKVYIRDGQWNTIDKWIQSKNGIFVNGENVDSFEGVELHKDDRLMMGDIDFILIGK